MLKNLETMFDNMSDMMKKLKKKSYEINMEQFLGKKWTFFSGDDGLCGCI